MSRQKRVAIAFGFGALLVAYGFALGVNPEGAEQWWRLLPPRRVSYNAFVAAEWLGTAARFFLAAGLAVEALALTAWIVAPRDDH